MYGTASCHQFWQYSASHLFSALHQLPILVTASLTIKVFCLYEICNPFGVPMRSRLMYVLCYAWRRYIQNGYFREGT